MGKAFVAKLAKEGARDPEALAAWIGRRKHGTKAFGKRTAAGRKKSGSSEPSNDARAAAPVKAAASPGAPKAAVPKQVAEMRAAIEHALANGWDRVPGAPGEVKIRRSQTHQTPSNIPASWWDQPTYESHEFVSVRVTGGRISAFHEESPSPWVGGRGTRSVSAKKAREILN